MKLPFAAARKVSCTVMAVPVAGATPPTAVPDIHPSVPVVAFTTANVVAEGVEVIKNVPLYPETVAPDTVTYCPALNP